MKRQIRAEDRPSDARIEWRGDEAGTLTADMLEQHAREIAVIEGRPPHKVTENDRERARLEMRDEELLLTSDDARSDVMATRNPAEPAVELGHQVKPSLSEDEQEISERETLEGVREAEHERMLLSHEETGEEEENP